MIAIIEAYKAGLLTFSHFKTNLIAGVVVGIVALPLAMAFAIASGVKPEQGIYTAIIAGLIIGLFGGTRTQISGPTGAFVVILATITAQYGLSGLQIATMMAGCILFIMGLFRFGNIIKIIPYPVIVGFTSGIGVIIFVSQLKDFFGLPITLPIDAGFFEKCKLLITALSHLDLITTSLSFACLFILIILPKFIKSIPGPLIAMLFAAFIQHFYHFPSVATIGSVFGEIPQALPKFILPDFAHANLISLVIPAISIAFLGAIESLLSAATADVLTGTKHYSNQELKGQGYANVIAPLFGGFASTGAIARTVTNIKHGGNSPIAAIVHALVLVLILLLLAPYAATIPFSALSAILFIVAYHMSDIPEFYHIVKQAPWYDTFVLLTTFLITIFLDLITAVTTGFVIAGLFFILRTHQTTKMNRNRLEHLKECIIKPKISISSLLDGIVYSFEGPFYFGVCEKFEQTLTMAPCDFKFVVFRLAHVPFMDMTGLKTFAKMIKKFQKREIHVYLCEANQKITEKLARVGMLSMFPPAFIFNSLEEIEIFRKNIST
jgi:SulP family sulfate permease